jgi:hypothetical protein
VLDWSKVGGSPPSRRLLVDVASYATAAWVSQCQFGRCCSYHAAFALLLTALDRRIDRCILHHVLSLGPLVTYAALGHRRLQCGHSLITTGQVVLNLVILVVQVEQELFLISGRR